MLSLSFERPAKMQLNAVSAVEIQPVNPERALKAPCPVLCRIRLLSRRTLNHHRDFFE